MRANLHKGIEFLNQSNWYPLSINYTRSSFGGVLIDCDLYLSNISYFSLSSCKLWVFKPQPFEHLSSSSDEKKIQSTSVQGSYISALSPCVSACMQALFIGLLSWIHKLRVCTHTHIWTTMLHTRKLKFPNDDDDLIFSLFYYYLFAHFDTICLLPANLLSSSFFSSTSVHIPAQRKK